MSTNNTFTFILRYEMYFFIKENLYLFEILTFLKSNDLFYSNMKEFRFT